MEPLLSYYSNQVLSPKGWDREEKALREDGREAPGAASLCSEREAVPFRAPWPGLLPFILKCQKLIRPEPRQYNSTVQTLRTSSPCNCQKFIPEIKSDPKSQVIIVGSLLLSF